MEFYLSVQSVKACQVVVIDRSVTLLHKQCSIASYLREVIGEHGIGDLRSLVRNGAKCLKGLEVQVNHLTYKRKYKVKDMTAERASEVMFTIEEEGASRTVSVVQFFAEKYGKKVDPNLPCLSVGTEKRPNYIPMDVCSLVPDQPVVRVSASATQELIRVSARKRPQERSTELATHCDRFCDMSKVYRSEFGIKVNKRPLVVEGRMLPSPAITYANIQELRPVDGKWDIRDKRFYKSNSLNAGEWAILCFDRNIRRDTVEELKNRLSNRSSRLGLVLEIQTMIRNHLITVDMQQVNYSKGENEKLFTNLHSKHAEAGHELRMIVCIMPQNQDLYQEIKLVGDCKKFIVTQGIHSKNCNDRKMNEQYIHNCAVEDQSQIRRCQPQPQCVS